MSQQKQGKSFSTRNLGAAEASMKGKAVALHSSVTHVLIPTRLHPTPIIGHPGQVFAVPGDRQRNMMPARSNSAQAPLFGKRLDAG